jgi:hypothetical protein
MEDGCKKKGEISYRRRGRGEEARRRRRREGGVKGGGGKAPMKIQPKLKSG